MSKYKVLVSSKPETYKVFVSNNNKEYVVQSNNEFLMYSPLATYDTPGLIKADENDFILDFTGKLSLKYDVNKIINDVSTLSKNVDDNTVSINAVKQQTIELTEIVNGAMVIATTALTTSNKALSNSENAVVNSSEAIQLATSADVNSNTAVNNSVSALANSETAMNQSQQALTDSNTALSQSEEASLKSNEAYVQSTEALKISNDAYALVSGSSKPALVFDTYDDMISYINNSENEKELITGRTFYIRDNGPDYWYDPTNLPTKVTAIDSDIPDISNMMTTDTSQNITGLKNFNDILLDGRSLGVTLSNKAEVSEITKINNTLSTKEDKVDGKSLIDDTLIIKLQNIDTSLYVDKDGVATKEIITRMNPDDEVNLSKIKINASSTELVTDSTSFESSFKTLSAGLQILAHDKDVDKVTWLLQESDSWRFMFVNNNNLIKSFNINESRERPYLSDGYEDTNVRELALMSDLEGILTPEKTATNIVLIRGDGVNGLVTQSEWESMLADGAPFITEDVIVNSELIFATYFSTEIAFKGFSAGLNKINIPMKGDGLTSFEIELGLMDLNALPDNVLTPLFTTSIEKTLSSDYASTELTYTYEGQDIIVDAESNKAPYLKITVNKQVTMQFNNQENLARGDIFLGGETSGGILSTVNQLEADVTDLKLNKADKTEIPKYTSSLTNNSGFITDYDLDTKVDPIIIKVNNLETDLETEVTNRQTADNARYLKTETYTRAEVDSRIDSKLRERVISVQSLPSTGQEGFIYLVIPEGKEYIYTDGQWIKFGDDTIDLTDYYTKSQTYNTTEVNDLLVPINASLNNKVDKVSGKGLSTNDYTTTEKTKLAGIQTGAQVNTVSSVAGKTGDITLTKSDVGLNNVDNTSDINKPISTAQQVALNSKVNITNSNNIVYGTTSEGVQTHYPVQTGLGSGTIPLRDSLGRFSASSPEETTHVTNKSYVDGKVNLKMNMQDPLFFGTMSGDFLNLSNSFSALNGNFAFSDMTNVGMEIGRQDGTPGTPYLDFHTDGNANNVTDYNVRMIATGDKLNIDSKTNQPLHVNNYPTRTRVVNATITNTNWQTVCERFDDGTQIVSGWVKNAGSSTGQTLTWDYGFYDSNYSFSSGRMAGTTTSTTVCLKGNTFSAGYVNVTGTYVASAGSKYNQERFGVIMIGRWK